MLSTWLPLLLLYLLIAAVPAVILKLRGFGWRPRFFGVSLLVAWTGGGWVVMVWVAMLEKRHNFALPDDKPGHRPAGR